MKQLLHTLYITEPDVTLRKEGETLIAVHGDGQKDCIPLHLLEQIISFSGAAVSPAVMDACVNRGIGFSALSQRGRLRFRVSGSTTGNVLLRKRQYLLSDQDRRYLAAKLLHEKLAGQRSVLSRFRRNHPAVQTDVFEASKKAIRELEKRLDEAESVDEMRGIEGRAARRYFDAFGAMILAEDSAFRFEERSRQPPLDRCNAMLSFGYTLLAEDCTQALESIGLDPQAGILHGDRPGKSALAFDMMETFRAPMVDRHVLRMINLRMISAEMFEDGAENGVFLNADGRKCYLKEWNHMRQQKVMIPELGQHVPRGLILHLQAARLASYLRGDTSTCDLIQWG